MAPRQRRRILSAGRPTGAPLAATPGKRFQATASSMLLLEFDALADSRRAVESKPGSQLARNPRTGWLQRH